MNKTFSTQSNSTSFTGERIRKITREERINLRATGSFKPNYVLKMFTSCIRDLRAMFTTSTSKKAKNSMCKYYGHVIQGQWKGYLPHCADCGAEITSPEQLRKAMPR